MSENYFLSVKSIGLSRIRGRTPCTLSDAIRHNRRAIQAEMGSIERIDPGLSDRNVILAGKPSCDQVQKEADTILRQCGIDSSTLRRDWVQGVEFLFGLGPGSPVTDRDRYWRSCVDWLGQTCKMHVLSADVHRDEVQEHLHCLVSPIQHGKYMGSKLIERYALQKLRESFWERVAGPAGLKRPNPKLVGHIKAAAAAFVIDHLKIIGDQVVQSAVWPLVQKDVWRDPVSHLEVLNLSFEQVRTRHLSMSPETRARDVTGAWRSTSPAGAPRDAENPNPMLCRDRQTNDAESLVKMRSEHSQREQTGGVSK